ncbi:hypothetical protein E2C01_035095 [Portunus trituberculatus]|uniref:Uncharacterized protein n=1 Tax=Portunus trituberculatus TaxID=210409 RepID=A0A5B7F4N3_PORTR|nr:hypothetical protein [Portunus trituberculatus]
MFSALSTGKILFRTRLIVSMVFENGQDAVDNFGSSKPLGTRQVPHPPAALDTERSHTSRYFSSFVVVPTNSINHTLEGRKSQQAENINNSHLRILPHHEKLTARFLRQYFNRTSFIERLVAVVAQGCPSDRRWRRALW